MTKNKVWTVGDLLGASSAYWRGCTLQAAVRLEVFTLIGREKLSVADVAEKVGADRRGLEFLLNGLAAMGLLIKEGSQYENTEESLSLLVKKSEKYIGHILLHHHHILDGWAQLDEAVKQGKPVKKRSYGEEVERESFLMGMFNLAMGIAPGLAKQVDLGNRKRLLDLGGGPGTYAIHFCLENPKLQAVVFDRQTTEPFARNTAAKFDLKDRIDFIGGDFTTDPISGGPYDVAWLSHILHSNGPETCQAIINKTVAEMEPGGQLFVHEFILKNQKDAPEFAALFSMNMLLNNPEGQSYSEEELYGMLDRAGLKHIALHSFHGPNDSSIIYGTV
jgi:precorrin-6B methylase 2